MSLKAGRPTGRLLTELPVCHWRQTTGLSPDGISFRCPLLCLFALILTAARLKEDLISIRLSFGFAQHNTSDPTTSHIPHIAYPQTSKTHPKPTNKQGIANPEIPGTQTKKIPQTPASSYPPTAFQMGRIMCQPKPPSKVRVRGREQIQLILDRLHSEDPFCSGGRWWQATTSCSDAISNHGVAFQAITKS